MIQSIDYPRMMKSAMTQVLAQALNTVAENGLPGDHHFVISFDTSNSKAILPGWLRVRHPNSMTIILQHWFENLNVSDSGFSVTLSFDGKPQDLYVPFEAISSFVDPGAKFGLQFKDVPSSTDKDAAAVKTLNKPITKPPTITRSSTRPADESKNVVSIDKFRKS